MNKFLTALVLFLSLGTAINAQVGIGTTSPEASAALDVSSTDKGFLMPRMTTAQRTAIVNPVNSLTVFDTDTKTFWSYIEGFWIQATPGVGKFIDGAVPEIAYYPERVGIGINNFSTVHKLYVQAKRSDVSFNTAVRIDAINEGTGNNSTTYGLGATAENISTGTIDYAIGTQGIVGNSNAGGTINYAVGTWPQVYNSGNVGYAAGLVAETTNRSGTITTVRGQDIGIVNQPGATMGVASLTSMYATNNGAISGDGYGLFIGGGGSGSVAGNSYALYLSTPFSNVAGNAYALYSDNVNNSYMEGNLGVGTSDPQQKVHISGVLRLEPQATPPTGGAGDLYAGTDNKLYFHDGTSWKEIQLVP